MNKKKQILIIAALIVAVVVALMAAKFGLFSGVDSHNAQAVSKLFLEDFYNSRIEDSSPSQAEQSEPSATGLFTQQVPVTLSHDIATRLTARCLQDMLANRRFIAMREEPLTQLSSLKLQEKKSSAAEAEFTYEAMVVRGAKEATIKGELRLLLVENKWLIDYFAP